MPRFAELEPRDSCCDNGYAARALSPNTAHYSKVVSPPLVSQKGSVILVSSHPNRSYSGPWNYDFLIKRIYLFQQKI